MNEDQYWYRYDFAVYSAGVDEWDNPLGPGRVALNSRQFRVLKVTPKGVQLDDYGRRRFVLNESKKRFACATREEALLSFIARKERQVSIMESRLSNVEESIRLARRELQASVAPTSIGRLPDWSGVPPAAGGAGHLGRLDDPRCDLG